MLETDRAQFSQIMNATAEVYNKPLSTTLLEVYWQDLKDFSIVDIRNALAEHRRDEKAGQFMPKPADLFKLLNAKKIEKYKNEVKQVVTVKTEHQLMLERGVEMLMQAAKQCGMTNKQFFFDRS